MRNGKRSITENGQKHMVRRSLSWQTCSAFENYFGSTNEADINEAFVNSGNY